GNGPLCKGFRSLLHADAVADVVAEHHLKTGKQGSQQEIRQRAQVSRRSTLQHHSVADISEDDELARGIAFIGFSQTAGQGRQGGGGVAGSWPGSRRWGHCAHQECSGVAVFAAVRTWL